MGARLTDKQIQTVCREVLARQSAPSCRSLRRALRERYGAVGRTERVYEIWKAITTGEAPSSRVTDAERCLWMARIAAAEERVRLAEERETKHQDRWANELYDLREQLRTRQGTLASGVSHELYRRVHQELLQVRSDLERLKQETGRD
jgi:hypothetical protein